MTRGSGKTKRILSYSERVGLEDQKKEAEATLKEAQTPGLSHGGEINTAKLQGEIAHLDKEIHDGSAPKIKGINKDRVWNEVRALEDKIKDGMPSREEMDHPARCPGAIEKHMNWDRRNRENINRYKELQRTLNPDAPVNIESLRRVK